MVETLPLKLLNEDDRQIFGSLNVALSRLQKHGFSVGNIIVVTAPALSLQTTLEHFDFGHKEVFEQSLTMAKQEILKIVLPEQLAHELKIHNPKGKKRYWLDHQEFKDIKSIWLYLMTLWLEEVKNRIWQKGFYPGITQNLTPQLITIVDQVKGYGSASYDPVKEDVVIDIKSGQLYPADSKKLDEWVLSANKKLFVPQVYEWILDKELKLVGLLPYTPNPSNVIPAPFVIPSDSPKPESGGMTTKQSAVRVFLDLSSGLVIDHAQDGVYLQTEKIYDLNKPRHSFDELVFKIVESAVTLPDKPVLVKLPDLSEGMGDVRGTLRLLHQSNLLEPVIEALDFARHKKMLGNVHIVVPFVRNVAEFTQIKRELAVKKLMRKSSLQLWLELAVPENFISLEDYIVSGLDGVVINLDEMLSFLCGFDKQQQELSFYKSEVSSLLKFMEEGLRILHKSKLPFIVTGSLALNPQVLDFLIEKGVFGIVVEKYEAHSMKDLLYQTEKRVILRRTS